VTTKQTNYQTDLQPHKYVLPSRGLVRPRKPFSLRLEPNEEWLSSQRILFRAAFFPVEAFLWITNLRLIVLANRWIKMPIVFEIPRTCIKSFAWHTSDHARWIDVNYENAGEQARIQLRADRRRSSRKDVLAGNEALLSQLHQIFHGHQKHNRSQSETISEYPNRLDVFSKAIIIVGMIVSICLIPYLAFQYHDAKQVLQVFNSSPACTAPGEFAKAVAFAGPCEFDQERIVSVYSRKSSRSRSYWAVLEKGADQKVTVELMMGEAFYKAAQTGDMVQVQWFNGKIVRVIDGPFSAIMRDNPQWQLNNVKSGLWLAGIFSLFSAFTILVTRRNLCW
jgi:hypothetical protein